MRLLTFMGWLAFLFASPSYSYTNEQVVQWGSDVMVQTLSASYLDTPQDMEEVRQHYMLAAWGPMLEFFKEKRAYIQTHHLTLTPKPLNKPTLLEQGVCHGAPCWRVQQSFLLPEIKKSISMSLLITPIGISTERGLIVASMDFTLQDMK